MKKILYLTAMIFALIIVPAKTYAIENIDPPSIEPPAGSTLIFNKNGGTGTMYPVSGLTGTYTLPTETTFVAPTGKVFVGWSLTNTGEVITKLEMDQTRTVYAIWKTPIIEATATITAPVHGALPSSTATSGNSTMYTVGGVANISEIKWKKDGTDYSNTTSFEGGFEYAPYIAFRAQSGYCFTSETVFKINGNIATEFNMTGSSLVVRGATYSFPLSAPTYTVSFDSNGGTGTMDDVTGLLGSYTLPATEFTAPTGKEFKGWSLTPNGEIITSIPMTEDKTVYAIWGSIYSYEYISGDNQELDKGKIKNYTIRVDGDYNKFTSLRIDSVTFEKDVDYTVSEGSTIITFTNSGIEKLNALEPGLHVVEINFTDHEVLGRLIINPTTNPKTGDNLIINIIIGIISTISIILCGLFIKNKRYS